MVRDGLFQDGQPPTHPHQRLRWMAYLPPVARFSVRGKAGPIPARACQSCHSPIPLGVTLRPITSSALRPLLLSILMSSPYIPTLSHCFASAHHVALYHISLLVPRCAFAPVSVVPLRRLFPPIRPLVADLPWHHHPIASTIPPIHPTFLAADKSHAQSCPCLAFPD